MEVGEEDVLGIKFVIAFGYVSILVIMEVGEEADGQYSDFGKTFVFQSLL